MSNVDINPWFQEVVTQKASDLYLNFGSPPCIRIGDTITPLNDTPLRDDDLVALMEQIANEQQRDEFSSTMELNFSLNWQEKARFRINIFRQQGHLGIVVRRIQMDIPTLEDLRLPPIYGELATLPRGLVLVVGQTGAGKTSSIAAMIGHRNRHGSGHIITVEDPIEFVHTNDRCLVSQRDVGVDTYSYAIALKNALRQRPDLVVIGEIRDREVMEQALYFSETGHLCIATLHASNASQAIERILNFFPEERHKQVLYNLAHNLKAILAQRLVRNVRATRTLATEIMINTGLIRNLIEENKVRQIHEMIERGATDGMRSFDQHLYDLTQADEILEETALMNADNAANLRLRFTNEKGTKRTVSHDLLLKKFALENSKNTPEKSEF